MRELSEDDAAPEPGVPAQTTTAQYGRPNDHGWYRRRENHGRSRRGHHRSRRRNHHGGSSRRDHHDWPIRHAAVRQDAADMPNLFVLMSDESDHPSFGATMKGRTGRLEGEGSPEIGLPSLTGCSILRSLLGL
jgi:hypothetical protein